MAVGEGMTGWVLLGAGVLTLFQVLWYQPRGMARTRARVAQRGDPRKFDAFLGSRWYRLSRWIAAGAGVVAVVLGALIMSGAW